MLKLEDIKMVKIHFSKQEVEGLGEVGIRLLTKTDLEKLGKMAEDPIKQFAYCLIGEDGKRVVSDKNLKSLCNIPMHHITSFIKKTQQVNGAGATQEELEKK